MPDGDIPFDRPSEAAILYAHMVDPPPRPSEHLPELPAELDEIVAKGMAKDADDRYASAGDMIRAAAAAMGVAPPPPSAGAATAPAATVEAPADAGRPTAPAPTPDVTRAAAIPVGDVTAPARVPEPPPKPAGPRDAPPAPAPPARRGGLPAPLLLLAAVLGVAAIVAGLLAGRSGSGDDGGADLSSSASAGSVALSFPSGWQRSRDDPGVPGLELSDPIVLTPPGGGGSRLVAGSTDAVGAPLLPVPFIARVGGPPERDDAVKLGDVQAYRYRDLRPRGLDGAVTVYTVPTTEGVVTLGCVAGASAAAGFAADCERVAASLELAGARAFPLGPSEDVAKLLDTTAGRLETARAAGTRKLRAADTPAAQARAASELARAYAAASRSLTAADVSPADAGAIGALAASLRQVGRGYDRAAAAARDEDSAAFAAAGRSVRTAGAAAVRAVNRLEQLGYTVPG